MANRRAAIAANIRARRPNGGTTAPNRSNPGAGTGGISYPGPGIGNRQSTGIGLSAGKATGPPKPQAPGAPPAQPSPMPWDVTAANDENAATKRLANNLSGLDAGWARQQQAYGLEGPWADYASNPYSRASLLQRSYNNAKRGTMNSAGRNLYAGSYINNQNANTHDFSMGRDELEKANAEAYASYIGNKQSAQDQYNEAISQAGWDRVNAGLAGEIEPTAVPGASKGKPKPKPKQPSGPAVSNRQVVIKQNLSKGKKAK